jgi:hypothetical protein
MATRRCIVRKIKFFLPALFLLFACMRAIAADVSLAWNPSMSTNITGYRVYVGNSSRNYGTSIQIGIQTTYTVTGLTDGTYYFAVTAFDGNGNESDFSNEVSKTIGSSGLTCNINGDGSVDVLDLQALANVILGIRQISNSFDLNHDGGVNVLDLQILNNVILGLRSCP